MLNYKNMTSVSLILLNCVEVAGIRVLHVDGDTRCLNWWQVIVAVFFFTWIVFFPLSLKLSYTMFLKDQISFPKFIVCLMIPFALVVSKILNRNVVSVALLKPINESYLKRILKECSKNHTDVRDMIQLEKQFSMKHDDCINEFFWHLLRHSLSILLSESHS